MPFADEKRGPRAATLMEYLGAAFGWRWNLLALGGAMTFALLSPVAGAAVPLIAAAELLYLTGLMSSSRFRKAIDVRVSGYSSDADVAMPTRVGSTPEVLMAGILRELGPGPRNRFLGLKERCESMLKIARGLGRDGAADSRNEGLDKLLWVFLRMLAAQQGLWKFLDEADERSLEQQIESLSKRRDAATEDERMARALTDALATATLRIDNIRNAKRNSEFIALELDRIENKILAISEMAVNNQQPDFISSQVDAVASSIVETENAMKELDYLAGMTRDSASAPPRIMQIQ